MGFIRKNAHVILIIIGSIFLALSVFHTNIWFDEAYSVSLVKHSFRDIWIIGGNDVHPILYYWLLKIVGIFFNYSILSYRVFSLLSIIFLGIVGYTHIRKDFGVKTGFIFSFMVFFLPIMPFYANQIRMYSLAIFFTTLLCIYGYRIYNGNSSWKNIILFGILSLLCIYTHYYSLMVAGIINLLLLIYLFKNKRKKDMYIIIIMGLIQIILYLPWLIYFITQIKNVSHGFWIGFIFPKSLIELTSFILLGNSIIKPFGIYQYLVFGTTIIIYVYISLRLMKMSRKEKKVPLIALRIYSVVIVAALIISIIMLSFILYYRYLFVITGLFIFVLSFILAKEKNKYIVTTICGLILIFGVINNINMIKDNYSSINQEPFNYIESLITKDTNIVFANIGPGFISNIVFNNNKHYFYNYEHWNIKEAYKAFSPNMEIYEETSFLDKCSNQILIVDSNDKIYNMLFNNGDYIKLDEKSFDTPYYDYKYKIILVEKRT